MALVAFSETPDTKEHLSAVFHSYERTVFLKIGTTVRRDVHGTHTDHNEFMTSWFFPGRSNALKGDVISSTLKSLISSDHLLSISPNLKPFSLPRRHL